MIAFLVDQNFNEHIVDGLTRRDATLKFTHVRDVGLAAAPDPTLLEWAAMRSLILLTHDRKTIPALAHARRLIPGEEQRQPKRSGKTEALRKQVNGHQEGRKWESGQRKAGNGGGQQGGNASP